MRKANSSLKIKYLITDVDGTLLKNTFKIFHSFSSKTLKEIRKFCCDNRKLVLASGRDLENTQKIAVNIERKVDKKIIPYLICLNGAVVFDNFSKRIIFNKVFSENSCWNIVNFLIRKDFCFFLLTQNKQIILRKTFLSFLIYLLFFRKYKPVFFNYLVSLKNIQKISLISFFPSNKKVRKLILENFGFKFYCSSLSCFYLELIDSSINKFYAGQGIARRMNVSENEGCAVGNEENDILLLENSPFGVFVDLKKAKHLEIDSVKFNFLTSNKRGVAVAHSIQELRRNRYY